MKHTSSKGGWLPELSRVVGDIIGCVCYISRTNPNAHEYMHQRKAVLHNVTHADWLRAKVELITPLRCDSTHYLELCSLSSTINIR